jgi:hypothetical protein
LNDGGFLLILVLGVFFIPSISRFDKSLTGSVEDKECDEAGVLLEMVCGIPRGKREKHLGLGLLGKEERLAFGKWFWTF